MATPILKEPPISGRDALIPYLVTAVNMLAPLLAAREILMAPVFITAVVLILIGVPSSVLFRQRGYNRIVLNLLTTIPLFILTWVLVRSHPGLQLDWSRPLESMLSHDSLDQLGAMLHVFVILAAGRAFLLVSSADLLQTPLPGISIFLLSVITNRELNSHPLTVVCLLLLFMSSAYLFSHEQHQQWFAIHTPPRVQRRLVLWTLIISLALFPLVFLTGSNLEQFNLFAMAARANRQRGQPNFRLPFGGSRTVIGFADRIEMGGLNWPTGKQPVMTVELSTAAPQGLLWRGSTYAHYENGAWVADTLATGNREAARQRLLQEGEGWTRRIDLISQEVISLAPKGPASDPGLVMAIKTKAVDLQAEGVIIKQKIKLDARMMTTDAPLYGAYPLLTAIPEQRVGDVKVTCDGAVYVSQAPHLSGYTAFSVYKPLPTSLKLPKDPELPDRARYLDMGTDQAFIKKIRAKADEFLSRQKQGDPTKPYDQVRQFEMELSQSYQYTLKPKPPPAGVDPIVDFLYTQKQGYCNYFSGAMVMLCRSRGIPARFVVGFATGDEVEARENADTVIYKVNASHAHSWVEVFLPRYGWYTVDPTAGSRLAPTVGGIVWDSIVETFTAVKDAILAWITAFRTDVRVRVMSIGLTFALLCLGLALYLLLRDRPPTLPRRALTPEEAAQMVLKCYQILHRWLLRWGVQKPDGATASEFAQLFRQLGTAMSAPVEVLTALYIRGQYGEVPLTDADARQAVQLLREIWTLARTERKRFYAQHETEV